MAIPRCSFPGRLVKYEIPTINNNPKGSGSDGNWLDYKLDSESANVIMFSSGISDGLYLAYWGRKRKSGSFSNRLLAAVKIDINRPSLERASRQNHIPPSPTPSQQCTQAPANTGKTSTMHMLPSDDGVRYVVGNRKSSDSRGLFQLLLQTKQMLSLYIYEDIGLSLLPDCN